MPTLRITRRAADRLHAGHLWVYRTDLDANQQADPGTIVTLTHANKSLGTAIYSSASQIAARLISTTPNLTRAQYLAEIRIRILAAIDLRRTFDPQIPTAQAVVAALHSIPSLKDQSIGVLYPRTNAERLVFSEADGLPGIIIDRYNDLIILQLLTQGTAQDDVREAITQTLRHALASNGETISIWERPDPRIRELEQLPPPPVGPLFGESKENTTFLIKKLIFTYNAAAGQKTGAFLDQRLNYAAAAAHVQVSGRTHKALDICTYQGGFALHLAQVCQRVTGIDASRAALEVADQNLALNPHLTGKVDWIEADAFDYLRHLDTASTKQDAIVLDPPAFAKTKRSADAALRGYKELNLRAIRLLNPGGTLITNSCSHHVSLADFTAIVAAAAADAHRRVQLLETRAAAPDHPEILTLPETRYLKCLILRID